MTHKNCGGNIIETKMREETEAVKYCVICHEENISVDNIE